MSKPLDITVTADDLALYIGHLVLQNIRQIKQIQILERRVDELDPLQKEIPNA